MSALWPRRATVTTCWPAARASFTTRTTASASRPAPTRQKRWRTARPTDGAKGLRAPSDGASDAVVTTAPEWSPSAQCRDSGRGAPAGAPFRASVLLSAVLLWPSDCGRLAVAVWLWPDLEVVHAATGHGRGVLLGLVHDDRLGGEEEGGDRGGVLEGRTGHL